MLMKGLFGHACIYGVCVGFVILSSSQLFPISRLIYIHNQTPSNLLYLINLISPSYSLEREREREITQYSSMERQFNYLVIIISVHLAFVASVTGASNIPSIFIFGDSIFDAGNNHYIKNCSAQADFAPYGSSFFHRPTGRFTNGRTVADFICKLRSPKHTHTSMCVCVCVRLVIFIIIFFFFLFLIDLI